LVAELVRDHPLLVFARRAVRRERSAWDTPFPRSAPRPSSHASTEIPGTTARRST
jgi:hypothetical protein